MIDEAKLASATATAILAVDTLMQEDEIPGGAKAAPQIPKLPRSAPPAGEEGAVREAARLLVNAE